MWEKFRTKYLQQIANIYAYVHLSDWAVDWVVQNGAAVITPDFTGYVFKVDPKYFVCGLLGADGTLLFMSCNPKRPHLSLFRLKRTIRKLLLNTFLEFHQSNIFQEFARWNNIPFDADTAKRYTTPMFK